MRQKTFDKLVAHVAERFGITEQEMFADSKELIPLNARQLLILLCVRHGVKVPYIRKYFLERGLDRSRSSIMKQQAVAIDAMDTDADLLRAYQEMESKLSV